MTSTCLVIEVMRSDTGHSKILQVGVCSHRFLRARSRVSHPWLQHNILVFFQLQHHGKFWDRSQTRLNNCLQYGGREWEGKDRTGREWERVQHWITNPRTAEGGRDLLRSSSLKKVFLVFRLNFMILICSHCFLSCQCIPLRRFWLHLCFLPIRYLYTWIRSTPPNPFLLQAEES